MELELQEIYNLYIEQNLCVDEISEKIGVSKRKIQRFLNKNNIKKDRNKVIELMKRLETNKKFPKFDELPLSSEYDVYRLYQIDISRISRDYVKYPFTKYYSIPVNELEYLYIELNLTKSVIATILNCSLSKIVCELNKHNIHKDEKTIKLSVKKDNIFNKREEHHTQRKDVKEKIKQTNLKKYGVENYSQTSDFKEKYKNAMLKKYGVENYFQIYDTNGRNNRTNKHISDENYEILHNKEKLELCLKSFDRAIDMASYLGITEEYLYILLKQHNIIYNFNRRASNYEIELREFLPNGLYNKKIYEKELDIYFENKNLGVEFNGNYWHSELMKSMNYHKDKSLYFMDKGVFVYHIFEYEWNDERKKPIIISQLNNLLGINNEKIYARKCIIKMVSKSEKRDFLNKNHMMGNDRCNLCIGLYFENELVSLMTFSKPKFNSNYQWELSRFCNKMNISVIGGASKLFQYFIINYNPQSIISYSDISKTKGLIYEKLGFKHTLTTRPNYVWWHSNSVLLKSQTRKSKLQEYDTTKSESQIMHERKYARIYNCGLKQWVWNNL